MYRMIDTATWDDPWFADLDPDAKLVFIYLITNRRSTAAGAFEITIRAMAFETGIAQQRIEAILQGFGDRVRWWPDLQVVWIRNFFKRQKANENFTKSAQKYIVDLPAPVQREIGLAYPELATDMGSDTPPEPIPTGSTTPSTVIVVEEKSNRSSEVTGERDGADAPAPTAAPAPKTKGTRMPGDFTVTDAMRQWARDEGASDQLIARETEKFRDYWPTVPGTKGLKLDWQLTWKNWIRRELERNPPASLIVHQGGRDSPPERPHYKRDGSLTPEGILARMKAGHG